MVLESQTAARRLGGHSRLGVSVVLMLLLPELNSPASGQFSSEWPIVELRQYTLHPGQRDVLIKLFESEFVESQEAVGMKIVGTFRDVSGRRPPKGASVERRALVVANICSFKGAVDTELVDLFETAALPQLKATGITVLGTHVTEPAPNNYPQLPVRTDRVFVWFTRFADRADYDIRMGALRSASGWSSVEKALRRACTPALETLRLQATPRSLLGA
jgi:hypothetical protein